MLAVAAGMVIGGALLVVRAASSDVPRGTHVLGADLGGRSRADAARVLRERVAERAGQPVLIRLDGEDLTLQPAEVGLHVDVDATVARAMRSGVQVAGLRLRGAGAVAPVVRLDRDRLEARLRARLARGAVTMRRPAITFVGGAARATYPETGLDLDREAAARTVVKAWTAGRYAHVELTARTPVATRADVDRLIATLAGPAVAAPVTVHSGDRSVRLGPAAIARSLVFRSGIDGSLIPAVDPAALRAALTDLETGPSTSRVKVGDRRIVLTSRPGRAVDPVRTGAALLAVLPRTAHREITATTVPVAAPDADPDLARLGVREKVSTFTTRFTGGRQSPRSQNIITIAAAVDGAVVRPGATFSLNGHTGERDYAAGYQDAPVIVGGRIEPGVGGGASQFTTTLFNAAYYAGLEDVEHKPHSFWFDRYPAVIESTIFYPTLDLKFRNTTPYGILIDTATSGNSVTVRLWSTKVYDSVRTVYGPRRDRTAPPTVQREAGPRCVTTSGLPGFTQDAWRVIRKDGREVERQRFHWRYDPEPRFVCGAS